MEKMIHILGAFVLLLAISLPGLLKAQLKIIMVFGMLWSSGLALAYIVAQGITLPIVDYLNSGYSLLAGVMGW